MPSEKLLQRVKKELQEIESKSLVPRLSRDEGDNLEYSFGSAKASGGGTSFFASLGTKGTGGAVVVTASKSWNTPLHCSCGRAKPKEVEEGFPYCAHTLAVIKLASQEPSNPLRCQVLDFWLTTDIAE